MIVHALGRIAAHGKWCLVLGLIAGLTMPQLALALRPWLPEMIALLLFLAALRIGPKAAFGSVSDIGRTLATLALYQFVVPLTVLAACLALGVAGTPWALAAVLVMAAPPLTGSPHFAVLMGRDPAVAMRLLLIGTAIFPLSALPVLWLSPAVDTVSGAIFGALRLFVVIFGAVGIAFVIRHWRWPTVSDPARGVLDGLAAILLGVVVIGLMAAAGPALRATPMLFAGWLVFTCVLNFGLQLLAARFVPVADEMRDRAGTAIVAGNRNVALFLLALPEATTEALLLFIGCYQVPMYLTPIVMRRYLAPRQMNA